MNTEKLKEFAQALPAAVVFTVQALTFTGCSTGTSPNNVPEVEVVVPEDGSQEQGRPETGTGPGAGTDPEPETGSQGSDRPNETPGAGDPIPETGTQGSDRPDLNPDAGAPTTGTGDGSQTSSSPGLDGETIETGSQPSETPEFGTSGNQGGSIAGETIEVETGSQGSGRPVSYGHGNTRAKCLLQSSNFNRNMFKQYNNRILG